MKLFGTAPNKRVAAIAQSVERILGKDEVASSNLASSSIFAAIAQPVERILGKDEVASSNLASSSKREAHPKDVLLFWFWEP